MSTSTFGVGSVVFAKIQERAQANNVPDGALKLALILLEIGRWFRPEDATDEALKKFVEYGRENRSNLFVLMRFVTGFIMEPKNVAVWGDGSNKPDFSKNGLNAIHDLGLNVGAIAAIIRDMVHENIIGEVKQIEFPPEDTVLYSVIPSVLSSNSWAKPESRVGMVDEESAIYTCLLTSDNQSTRWGNTTGVFDFLGLPERTTVLYHQSGFVMDLKLDGPETASLLQADWNDIPWMTIFPNVTLIPEPRVASRKVHEAPTALTTVAEPKAEVPGPLPAIPEWIPELHQVALEKLLKATLGGDEYVALHQAETKAQFLAKEAETKATAAQTAKLASDAAAAELSVAQRAFEATAPARSEARQNFSKAIKALETWRRSQLEVGAVLGIEVEVTSPELV